MARLFFSELFRRSPFPRRDPFWSTIFTAGSTLLTKVRFLSLRIARLFPAPLRLRRRQIPLTPALRGLHLRVPPPPQVRVEAYPPSPREDAEREAFFDRDADYAQRRSAGRTLLLSEILHHSPCSWEESILLPDEEMMTESPPPLSHP